MGPTLDGFYVSGFPLCFLYPPSIVGTALVEEEVSLVTYYEFCKSRCPFISCNFVSSLLQWRLRPPQRLLRSSAQVSAASRTFQQQPRTDG